MKTNIFTCMILTTFFTINFASACVIAVESNIEESLFKNSYSMYDLKLTTDTSSADVGLKVLYESETSSTLDPVFGTIKSSTNYKRSAQVYERGVVVASTGFHPILEVGKNAAFARDLRKALSRVGCTL